MKAIVYYTHNHGAPAILDACRRQLDRARGDIPVVAVSQHPLDWGDVRIVMKGIGRSDLSMFRQQLAGLEATDQDTWVYFCEHDVLYHPSHFEFWPPTDDAYWFNWNVWAVDAETGQALHYHGMRMTSGTVASRDILIEHYRKKIEWTKERGKFSRQLLGYEPGKRISRKRLGDYPQETFYSRCPNIDIKHGGNITRGRFDPKEFRNWERIKDSWTLADEVPNWGRCKGRFAEFLEEVTHGN
jgi:hypothetical protein